MRFVPAKKGRYKYQSTIDKSKNRNFAKYQTTESPLTQNESRGFLKTAATYSPTVTQYHRRDEA